ncbi:MAG TPA: hypothetical protein DCS07_05580 [Bdellovibrionales bacterium]|nr:hypothetical protein [Bdellovibrionales bacterium]
MLRIDTPVEQIDGNCESDQRGQQEEKLEPPGHAIHSKAATEQLARLGHHADCEAKRQENPRHCDSAKNCLAVLMKE